MKKLFKSAAIIVTLVIILVIGVTTAAMAAGPNPNPGTCPNTASNGDGTGVCPNPDCPNATLTGEGDGTGVCPNPDCPNDGDGAQYRRQNANEVNGGAALKYQYQHRVCLAQ
jgi:hypothetical protein